MIAARAYPLGLQVHINALRLALLSLRFYSTVFLAAAAGAVCVPLLICQVAANPAA
jgi:hypothetical protein